MRAPIIFLATVMFSLIAAASGQPARSAHAGLKAWPADGVPPEVAGLLREGREQFERGDFAAAKKTYEAALARVPDSAYVLSNLGVIHFRLGDYAAAVVALKKAVAAAPDDGFSHRMLGSTYYFLQKTDEAVGELKTALRIDPKDATAHNYYGITASGKGWPEIARTELEAAVALDPDYADAHFNLAVVLAIQQPPDKENARKHYARARELHAERDESLEKLFQ